MVNISIISGFLGAGKTTLIRQLLKEEYWGRSPVLIENDYGSLGMDQIMLKETGVRIRDMTAGCICCSLMGNFVIALEEVIREYQPAHIIIEPSGVGKLSEILQGLKGLSLPWRLGQVITVVDASRFLYNDQYVEEYFWDQITRASIIILNKSGKVKEEKRRRIEQRLAHMVPDHRLLMWEKGDPLTESLRACADIEDRNKIHPGRIMAGKKKNQMKGLDDRTRIKVPRWERELADLEPGNIGSQRAGEKKQWTSLAFTLPGYVRRSQVEEVVEKLRSDTSCGMVLRAKGILELEGVYHYLNYVPGLFDLEPCQITDPEDRKRLAAVSNRLILIGRNLKEEEIRKILKRDLM